jgi:alpha-1,3-mannosyltransferase
LKQSTSTARPTASSPSSKAAHTTAPTRSSTPSLIPELAALNISYHSTTNNIDPKAGNGVDRVEALATLRNQALQPLHSSPETFSPDTAVVFIKDVALRMEDMLELIHQRLLQKANATCAVDWIYGDAAFYDVWVSRALNSD